MNDEFVTHGIEEHRYLKTIQLIDRFETEIRGELERASKEFVEGNRELFVDDPTPRWNKSRNPGNFLAFARIDRRMARLRLAEDDAAQLKLNLAIRWLDPSKHGIDSSESVLCVASYKIKNVSEQDHELVKERTRSEDEDINYYPDPYDAAPDEFYVPVENAEDLRRAFQKLNRHFSKYGLEYGVTLSDTY